MVALSSVGGRQLGGADSLLLGRLFHAAWLRVEPRVVHFVHFNALLCLFKLVQMSKPCQNNGFTRLLDLSCKKHFIQYRVYLYRRSAWRSHNPYPAAPVLPSKILHMTPYLVEIEHKVELAHIPKKGIQHFDKKVYRFEVGQLVVVRIDARAEEEAGIPPVDYLRHVAELDEVGLVFLVPRSNEAVDLQLCQASVG